MAQLPTPSPLARSCSTWPPPCPPMTEKFNVPEVASGKVMQFTSMQAKIIPPAGCCNNILPHLPRRQCHCSICPCFVHSPHESVGLTPDHQERPSLARHRMSRMHAHTAVRQKAPIKRLLVAAAL